MNKVSDRCPPPPSLASFRVGATTGDRFARLRWTSRQARRLGRQFHFELDWWSQPGETDAVRLILPPGARSALLNNLADDVAYSVRLSARSDCDGRVGLGVTLNFTTRTPKVDSTIRRMMMHEVALITLVLFIWLLIVWHFVQKYKKMTFVSPRTAVVNGRTYNENKTKSDDSGSYRRGSELSAKSKASTKVDKFELLEGVVSKWRSEAVLEGGRTLNSHDVASLVERNADAHSGISAGTKCKKLNLLSPPERRISTVTISTDVRTRPISRNVNSTRPIRRSVSPIFIPAVRISKSYPLFRQFGSGSILNRPDRPHIEDYEENPEAPPCSPNQLKEDEVSDAELERCRLLAKLSNPQSSGLGLEMSDGTIRRKISEVLLGKATVDIRRSSMVAYLRRPKASKHALVRRQSIFERSFRSFKKSFRRKRVPNSDSTEVASYENSGSLASRRPVFGLPSIESQESTPRARRSQIFTQQSTESYFTAADVVIQIADVDGGKA